MAGPITQKQLSDIVGVSQMTVSYAFNQPGRLAPKTLERVLRAAREYGYRPNSAARAQKQGRFDAICLLLRWNQGKLPGQLLRAIEHELNERNKNLHLNWLPQEQVDHQIYGGGPGVNLPRILRESCVDGLLIYYAHTVSQHTADLIAEQNVPVIWLDNRMTFDSISFDEYQAASLATQRLLELGHRRIAFLEGHRENQPDDLPGHWQTERQNGVYRTMQESGQVARAIDYPILRLRDYDHSEWPSEFLKALTVALQRPDRPTAILTDGSSQAVTVLLAATRLGLRVPEDLSIIAYHPNRFRSADITFTTMILPFDRLGERGVEMMDRKIKEPDKHLQHEIIPCDTLIEGVTTARPPSDG